MKLKYLFCAIFIITLCMNLKSQSIKGIKIGGNGLLGPLWGKKQIQTTIFEKQGIVSVEKFKGKIISINYRSLQKYSETEAEYLAEQLNAKDDLNLIKNRSYSSICWTSSKPNPNNVLGTVKLSISTDQSFSIEIKDLKAVNKKDKHLLNLKYSDI